MVRLKQRTLRELDIAKRLANLLPEPNLAQMLRALQGMQYLVELGLPDQGDG
jgi:hypothetical protein